jgi:hypothetical protein
VSDPDNEERGKRLNKPVEKEKRWADVMEEDEAKTARARAELDEERQRWRSRLQGEEVLNLDAPSSKTVMELLAEREAQSERAEQPKAGTKPLGEGLVKPVLPKEGSPSLKTGEEGEGERDEAMEMALKIKDPKVQATVARALNTTRLGTTESKDSESTTDKEEEERVSAKEERARKKAKRAKKKSKKAKGIKRADSQTSGKQSDRKIKRSKGMEEVEERETEEAQEPALDLEMMDVQDPSDEQPEKGTEQVKGRQEVGVKEQRPETEQLKEETGAERLKRKQTEQEGKKMVQESVEKVLKKPASARAGSKTLNVQEGQEPKKEPESQELTDLLKGVRAQCGEVKDLLHQAVGSGGRAPTATQPPSEFDPKASPRPSVKRCGGPLLNPSPLELPVAPPPVPVEMRDAQVQAGERNFWQGRETWDVTFLSTGYVRVEKLVRNSQGQFEEPSEETMSVEKFFRTKPTWPPYIRAFKFQNEALPSLLGRGIDRIF